MKIAQVRANYYFEFLRIIVMLPMHMALAKYGYHVNYTIRLIFKIKNNNKVQLG